jgi:S1-C subfamily serine protease
VRLEVSTARERTAGTGLVVESGRIVTAGHLARRPSQVEVAVRGRREGVTGRIAYRAQGTDPALVRAPTTRAPSATLGDERVLRSGQRLFALGYPQGAEGEAILTSGYFVGPTVEDGVPVLKLDMALNPGNSGGPVFIACGEVVGFASFRNDLDRTEGFAVAASGARRAIDAYRLAAVSQSSVPPPAPPLLATTPPTPRPLPPPAPLATAPPIASRSPLEVVRLYYSLLALRDWPRAWALRSSGYRGQYP